MKSDMSFTLTSQFGLITFECSGAPCDYTEATGWIWTLIRETRTPKGSHHIEMLNPEPAT